MGETRTRAARTLALVCIVAAATSSCATLPDTGEPGPVDDVTTICGLVVAGVGLVPCMIAGGVGWVAGACTRCGEGAPPDDTPQGPVTEERPPVDGSGGTVGGAAAAMEY